MPLSVLSGHSSNITARTGVHQNCDRSELNEKSNLLKRIYLVSASSRVWVMSLVLRRKKLYQIISIQRYKAKQC